LSAPDRKETDGVSTAGQKKGIFGLTGRKRGNPQPREPAGDVIRTLQCQRSVIDVMRPVAGWIRRRGFSEIETQRWASFTIS
jgi:hypothetical protein